MSLLAALDDTALLERVSRGSEEAISVLYDRFGRMVFGIALHLVGDRETAEEIVQDVFTSVWEKVGTYRAEQSKVTTWISRIARNRAIDELRRRKARPQQRSVSWENGMSEELARERDPEEHAELAFTRQRVRAALASLPPEQKEVLALAYFQAYSHSEIAETLGQPLGTVKTRIRMGMQKLAQLLGEEPS